MIAILLEVHEEAGSITIRIRSNNSKGTLSEAACAEAYLDALNCVSDKISKQISSDEVITMMESENLTEKQIAALTELHYKKVKERGQ